MNQNQFNTSSGEAGNDETQFWPAANASAALQSAEKKFPSETVDSDALPNSAPVEVTASVSDRKERTLKIIVTTSRIDRQGDCIETSGLDFSQYLNNPVVLWAHDLQRPPVGRVLEILREGHAVQALVQFADTAFAREVFSLYAGGFLNAWSIGFLPQRWQRLPEEQGGGYHILQAEVVEISAVPVPANPEALTKALEVTAGQKSAVRRGERPQRCVRTLRLAEAARAVADLLGTLTGKAIWKAQHNHGASVEKL